MKYNVFFNIKIKLIKIKLRGTIKISNFRIFKFSNFVWPILYFGSNSSTSAQTRGPALTRTASASSSEPKEKYLKVFLRLEGSNPGPLVRKT